MKRFDFYHRFIMAVEAVKKENAARRERIEGDLDFHGWEDMLKLGGIEVLVLKHGSSALLLAVFKDCLSPELSVLKGIDLMETVWAIYSGEMK